MRPLGRRIAAEDALNELAAAGADQAVKPDDLALAHRDRDVVEAVAGELFGLENRRADRDLVLVVDLIDRPVDHQRDEIGFVGLADPARADQRAVAQDRDAIAEFEHLLEPVADIDDRDAVGLQPADQLEQRRRFLAREIGGRLVEDQELRAAPLRARGGDELLLADGERRQQRAGRQVEAEVVEQLLRIAHHALVVEQTAAHLFVAEEDVGRNREVRAEHHFLMDRVDAEADRFVRIGQRDRLRRASRLSPELRGWTPVRSLISVDLPAPFSPTIGVNFAFLEGEIDGPQRVGRAEALVELLAGRGAARRRRGVRCRY